MGWKVAEGRKFATWDGADFDFPRLPRTPLDPLSAVPVLAADYAEEGTLTSNVFAATRRSDPLVGRSVSLVYFSAEQERGHLPTDKGLAGKVRNLTWGFWWFLAEVTGADVAVCLRPYGCAAILNRYPRIPDGAQCWTNDIKNLDCLLYLHSMRMLERRYLWSVTLRHKPEHVGICLPSDPTGVLAMLRDREKTGTRRSPLLHWVKEHLRQNRNNEDALYEVRAHLRGKRTCEWRGYRVEIRESELEREQEANR